jgi:hypothetical protein
LRHDATASGKGVRELDEAEFGTAPKRDLLTQTTEMHHYQRRIGTAFDHEVTVADGVQAILSNRRKIE